MSVFLERALLSKTELASAEEKRRFLLDTGFVRVEGGKVLMGTDKPLKCKLEVCRWNETPLRFIEISPFWICRIKVTNSLFEIFNPTHKRPPQSQADDMPVVDITYGEALTFCEKLNDTTGMTFRLPTEPEWTRAAAPNGWWFVYGPNLTVDITQAHTYGDGNEHSCAPVSDPRWKPNYLGLDQMGHNVSEFTLGHYRTSEGHWGATDDGMYCIVRGGNWGHCAYSARVNRRFVVDVSDRNPRIGFRLAHNDI